jgi:hypothetical protein
MLLSRREWVLGLSVVNDLAVVPEKTSGNRRCELLIEIGAASKIFELIPSSRKVKVHSFIGTVFHLFDTLLYL